MSSPMTLPSRFILYLAPFTNGAVLEFSPESAMKKLLIAAALACAPLTTFAADHYTLDPHHTFARFPLRPFGRSEERRGGKECVSTCRSQGAPYHKTKKKK